MTKLNNAYQNRTSKRKNQFERRENFALESDVKNVVFRLPCTWNFVKTTTDDCPSSICANVVAQYSDIAKESLVIQLSLYPVS